jgi:hypothetical protein
MTAPSGTITIAVLCLSWCINMLFGILIARAIYQAIVKQDTNAYLNCVRLNDTLDTLRNTIANTVAGWGAANFVD